MFVTPEYVNKVLVWHRKFRPAQNILGPVKGQGTRCLLRDKGLAICFYAGTKVFEEALNAIKFLDWHKTLGPAQNILGPVKGQGTRRQCIDGPRCIYCELGK